MILKPILAIGIFHETNYYSSRENKRSVTTYYLKPKLELGYTTTKTDLVLNYSLTSKRHDEKGGPHPGKDISHEDYIGHDLAVSAETQITDRLNTGIKDAYVLARDLKYVNFTIDSGYQERHFNENGHKNPGSFVWSASLSASRPHLFLSLSHNYNDTALGNKNYLATRFSAEVELPGQRTLSPWH